MLNVLLFENQIVVTKKCTLAKMIISMLDSLIYRKSSL